MSAPSEVSTAGVYGAIAAYAQALDAGRIDDIVELFCPDGIAEIAGMGVFAGREEIRRGYSGWVPKKPQLHLTGNTVVTVSGENEATATSSLVFLVRGADGWAVQMVGRYDDTLRRHDGVWRFQRRVTTFLP